MGQRGPQPGSKKTGGRQKGSKNKNRQAIIDKLDALNCDPIEGMATIAKQAMQEGDKHLAGSMYKELAQYVVPKLKAIEHTGIDGSAIEHNHTVSTINFKGV